MNGTEGGVKIILRLEGVALLCAATAIYAHMGGDWRLFAILFLAPDLSFLGYAAGPRAGAFAYNLLHSTIGPVVLAGAALLWNLPLLGIALIWAAHIGADRGLGYGLKYARGFSHTHLGRIGRQAQ